MSARSSHERRRLRAFRARLLRAGLDGFAEHFRLVVDAGPADEALWRRALAVFSGSRAPEDRAWTGRLRACLGEEGAAADLAQAETAGVARARGWWGGFLAAQGRYVEAIAVLEGAGGWDAFVRACALFGAGRAKEADAVLSGLRRNKDRALAAAAAGLEALSASARGEGARARALLSAAARLSNRRAWPWILRARMERSSEDKKACLRALDKAVELEDVVWTRLERSRVYEVLGDLSRALDDANAAVRAAPACVSALLWRAHVQTCRRHYHLASRDYARVLRIDASCAAAWRGAAAVELTVGEPRRALALARGAERASGGDAEAVLERIRFQIYAGRATPSLDREAFSVVRGRPDLSWRPPFLRGARLLKARRFEEAARAFAAAGRAPGSREAALKSSFYGAIAAGLESTKSRFPPRTSRSRPRLMICGLGIVPPYTTTLESLRMIAACDYVFNNLSEPENADLIWMMSNDGEPTMFDIRGNDVRWTRAIFRQLKPGRTVGFVTRGHPQVCGGLASSLMEECERRGVDFEISPAVSSMNTLAIKTLPGGLTSFWGQQALECSTVFSPEFSINRRVPTILYFNAEITRLTAREYGGFCRRLEAAVGAGRRVLFYGRSFIEEPDAVPIEALRAWYGRIDPSYTLLIPPA